MAHFPYATKSNYYSLSVAQRKTLLSPPLVQWSNVLLFTVAVFAIVLTAAASGTDQSNIVVNKKDAINYLTKYGYILATKKVAGPVTSDELRQALRNFQRMAALAPTGKLDYATLRRMSQPRCGVRDDLQASVKTNSEARLRFSTFSRWPKTRLTWHIASFSTHMPKRDQQMELQRAYDSWATAAGLEIAYQSAINSDVDLKVSFLRGQHGDNEPFDGPGGALGHAFFPRFGGATHFDDEEKWSANSTSGVNLFQVAAHEFGHALGLGHSDVQDAVMAPFYKPYSATFELHADDVQGIRTLYSDDATGAVHPSAAASNALPSTEQNRRTSPPSPPPDNVKFVLGGSQTGGKKDLFSTKFWESPNHSPPPPAGEDTANSAEIDINVVKSSSQLPSTPKITISSDTSPTTPKSTTATTTVRSSSSTATTTSPLRTLPPPALAARTTLGSFGAAYGAPPASPYDGFDHENLHSSASQMLPGFSPFGVFGGGGGGGGGPGEFYGGGGGGGYGGGGGGSYYGGVGAIHGGYDQFVFPFPTYKTTTTTEKPTPPTTTTHAYAPAYPAFNPFFFGHGHGGGGGYGGASSFGGGGGGGYGAMLAMTTTPRPEHKYADKKKSECDFRDVDCIIRTAYGQYQEAQATFFNGFYSTTTRRPTTTQAPETVCELDRIDAISSDEWGGFWVFNGRRFFYLNVNYVQLRAGLTTELDSRLTDGVTAAYYKNKYLFLFDEFRDFQYYKFDATDYRHLVVQDEYPRAHADGYPGLQSANAKIEAVLERHDLTLLMFQSGRMYKYNPFEHPPIDTARYPILLKDVSLNFPANITAALFHLHYGSFVFDQDGVWPVTSYGDLALRYPQRPALPLEAFFRCNHYGGYFGGHVRSDGGG